MSQNPTHEPTFGPRESAIDHPMPGPTEELIAEQGRVQKHLAEIRAKCRHHFVPSGTLEEMGFKETLVHGVWNLQHHCLATFICTECAKGQEVTANATGQCPCCGTKLNYQWISGAEQKKYFGDQEFDWYDSPAFISCPNCDFKGAKMLFDR
jgi:hypothetical protein